jgi:hypothetical protein
MVETYRQLTLIEMLLSVSDIWEAASKMALLIKSGVPFAMSMVFLRGPQFRYPIKGGQK